MQKKDFPRNVEKTVSSNATLLALSGVSQIDTFTI